jgi:uncharacterized membrane protein
MSEGARDGLVEQVGNSVDQEVQTQEIQTLVPQNCQGSRWRRRVQYAFALLLVGFVCGVVACYYVLATLPNFRRYMFGEQEEVNTVTEAEQNMLTSFNLSLLSICYATCLRIYKFLRSFPWLWGKILEYTSLGFFGKLFCNKIREQVVKHAFIPMLKRYAFDFLKTCFQILIIVACTTLMIIGLRSVLHYYNFPGHVKTIMSFMCGAISAI